MGKKRGSAVLGVSPTRALHQDTVWLCVSIDRLDYFAHPTLMAIFFYFASCLLPLAFPFPSALCLPKSAYPAIFEDSRGKG